MARNPKFLACDHKICRSTLAKSRFDPKLATGTRNWGVAAFGIALAGASLSADIAPAYVSPVAYQSYTCQQLALEAQAVSTRAATLSGAQDNQRTKDSHHHGRALATRCFRFDRSNGRPSLLPPSAPARLHRRRLALAPAWRDRSRPCGMARCARSNLT